MRKRLFAVLFVVGILCAGVASAGWFDWFDRFFEKPELSPSEQCGVFIDITPVPIRASTQDSLHPLSHSVDSNLQTYWTVGSVVSTSDELVYDLGNVLCIMGGSIMLPQGTGVGLSVFISEDGSTWKKLEDVPKLVGLEGEVPRLLSFRSALVYRARYVRFVGSGFDMKGALFGISELRLRAASVIESSQQPFCSGADADRNGVVDSDDYARIDSAFAARKPCTFPEWCGFADMDRNGVVDSDDYAAIDSAYGAGEFCPDDASKGGVFLRFFDVSTGLNADLENQFFVSFYDGGGRLIGSFVAPKEGVYVRELPVGGLVVEVSSSFYYKKRVGVQVSSSFVTPYGVSLQRDPTAIAANKPGSIRIEVRDRVSGQPVSSVQVILGRDGTNYPLQQEQAGVYVGSSLAAGLYNARVVGGSGYTQVELVVGGTTTNYVFYDTGSGGGVVTPAEVDVSIAPRKSRYRVDEPILLTGVSENVQLSPPVGGSSGSYAGGSYNDYPSYYYGGSGGSSSGSSSTSSTTPYSGSGSSGTSSSGSSYASGGSYSGSSGSASSGSAYPTSPSTGSQYPSSSYSGSSSAGSYPGAGSAIPSSDAYEAYVDGGSLEPTPVTPRGSSVPSVDSSGRNYELPINSPDDLFDVPESVGLTERKGYIVLFDKLTVVEKTVAAEKEIASVQGQLRESDGAFGFVQRWSLENELSGLEKELKEYPEIAVEQQNEELQEIAAVLERPRLSPPSDGGWREKFKQVITGVWFSVTGRATSVPSTLEGKVTSQFTTASNSAVLAISDAEAEQLKDAGYTVYPNELNELFLMDSVPLIGADRVWEQDAQGNDCVESGGECLTGKGQTIAVLDTGVDYTHPDLGGCFGDEDDAFSSGYERAAIICTSSPCIADASRIGSRDSIEGKSELNSPNTVDGCQDGKYGKYLEDESVESISVVQSGSGEFIAGGNVAVSVEAFCYDEENVVHIEYKSGDRDFEIVRSFRCSYGEAIETFSHSFNLDSVEGYHVIRGFITYINDFDMTCGAGNYDDADDVVLLIGREQPVEKKECKVIGGYDFSDNDDDPMDYAGHGTHVAATAAGNGVLRGVAPDAEILAYKVFPEAYDSVIIAAIERAIDPNNDGDFSDRADVISMSLGGDGNPDDPMSRAVDAVTEVGSVVVVAAGNSGPDTETIGSPGVARKVITVGAIDKSNNLAEFSSRGSVLGKNYGYVKPDVVAPGHLICAARYGSEFMGRGLCVDDRHVLISGTSMATPMVSGVAALVRQAHPDWSSQDIKRALKSSANNLGISPNMQGSGSIDALKAVHVDGKLPLAEIKTGGTVSGRIDIRGSASGTDFKDFSLYYSVGDNYPEWIEVTTRATPINNGLIYSGFDTSLLRQGINLLMLVVRTNDGKRSEYISVLFIPDPDIKEGWPIIIDDGVSTASINIGDINGDGNKEILYSGGYFAYAWDSNGRIVSGWPRQALTELTQTPTVSDINKDGKDEVFVSGRNHVYAWDGNGDSLFGWPIHTWNYVMYSPTISDIDNDGSPDIIVAGADQSCIYDSCKIYVYDKEGNLLPGWPQITDVYAYAPPAVADIDGDGNKEIIVAGPNWRYYDSEGFQQDMLVFKNDGQLLWKWRADSKITSWISNNPMISDLNGDGKKEVVLTAWEILDSNKGWVTGSVRIFDSNGNIINMFNSKNTPFYPSALANLDNDPQIEIVPAPEQTSFNGFSQFELYNIDGTKLKSLNILVGLDNLFQGGSAIADINGDGSKDFIIASWKDLFAFDVDGKMILGWPKNLRAPSPGFGSARRLFPIIGDLEDNNKIDIVLGKEHGIFVYEIDSPFSPVDSPWPMFQHDAQHTGCYDCDDGIKEDMPVSRLHNLGGAATGNLILRIDTLADDGWVVYRKVFEGSVSVPAGGSVALDQYWNGQGIKASEAGTYRVIAIYDPDDGADVMGSFEFEVV